MRPAKAGKGIRMSFSRQKEVLEMPNLIEIQKNSYQWFLDEGLHEVFDDKMCIRDRLICCVPPLGSFWDLQRLPG